MAVTKVRLNNLLGPVLGSIEKSAPNQVTGKNSKRLFEWTDRENYTMCERNFYLHFNKKSKKLLMNFGNFDNNFHTILE